MIEKKVLKKLIKAAELFDEEDDRDDRADNYKSLLSALKGRKALFDALKTMTIEELYTEVDVHNSYGDEDLKRFVQEHIPAYIRAYDVVATLDYVVDILFDIRDKTLEGYSEAEEPVEKIIHRELNYVIEYLTHRIMLVDENLITQSKYYNSIKKRSESSGQTYADTFRELMHYAVKKVEQEKQKKQEQ